MLPSSSLKSYRYTFLSHEATAKRLESGFGENLTAEMASDGGEDSSNWAVDKVSCETGVDKDGYIRDFSEDMTAVVCSTRKR